MADYEMGGTRLEKPYTAAKMRKLIGRKFWVLTKYNIDRWRGSYWPELRTLTSVRGRNLCFDDHQWKYTPDVVQLNLIDEE